ncbi:hypothetical protein FIU97_07020 [Roseivivax sp. THAF40]|uniref:hypothetical protein n=1 Tax=unclassified Roseivivax TaxID=2639302 RepID=UPI0012A863AD|nr:MULTISPECIES: hypothetical protein [unclassified Roseivivax]QFS82556.1 hypothetical protein FIV09_06920 [Roseivivax sp. THAF197b]QFT46325.1 hypothetical protein FIU97_07020 [Roseivivax sp. THAF40]
MKTLSLAAIASLAALPAAAHTDTVLHIHNAETGAMIVAAFMVVVGLALAFKR